MMPPDLQRTIEGELRSGETVVWQGQPIPGRYARGGWCLVLFGIPWTAFSIFWVVMASGITMGHQHGPPLGVRIFFPLFGLPFVVIGLGMLSSPFWMKRKALKVAYVVTDQRAILIEGGWRGGVTVRSFGPDQLNQLERREHADGSGDLIFERHHGRDSDGERRSREIGFLAVPEVKKVEELIRGLQAPPRQS